MLYLEAKGLGIRSSADLRLAIALVYSQRLMEEMRLDYRRDWTRILTVDQSIVL